MDVLDHLILEFFGGVSFRVCGDVRGNVIVSSQRVFFRETHRMLIFSRNKRAVATKTIVVLLGVRTDKFCFFFFSACFDC